MSGAAAYGAEGAVDDLRRVSIALVIAAPLGSFRQPSVGGL